MISWDWHLKLPPKIAMPNFLTFRILDILSYKAAWRGGKHISSSKEVNADIFSNRVSALYFDNVRNQKFKLVRRRANTFFKLELTIQTIYDDNSQGIDTFSR